MYIALSNLPTHAAVSCVFRSFFPKGGQEFHRWILLELFCREWGASLFSDGRKHFVFIVSGDKGVFKMKRGKEGKSRQKVLKSGVMCIIYNSMLRSPNQPLARKTAQMYIVTAHIYIPDAFYQGLCTS